MSLGKKKCCQDCKNGKRGVNESCKAKMLVKKLRKQHEGISQGITEV